MRATSAALSSDGAGPEDPLSARPFPILLLTSSTRSDSSEIVRAFSSSSFFRRSFSDVAFCSSVRVRSNSQRRSVASES